MMVQSGVEDCRQIILKLCGLDCVTFCLPSFLSRNRVEIAKTQVSSKPFLTSGMYEYKESKERCFGNLCVSIEVCLECNALLRSVCRVELTCDGGGVIGPMPKGAAVCILTRAQGYVARVSPDILAAWPSPPCGLLVESVNLCPVIFRKSRLLVSCELVANEPNKQIDGVREDHGSHHASCTQIGQSLFLWTTSSHLIYCRSSDQIFQANLTSLKSFNPYTRKQTNLRRRAAGHIKRSGHSVLLRPSFVRGCITTAPNIPAPVGIPTL